VIRGRLHRTRRAGADAGEPAEEIVEFDAAELSGVLALPDWLRNVGMIAWLTTGVIVLLLGLVWLLSLANTIVMPLIAAGIVAAVGSPVVRWLNGHGVPRAAGAAILLLAIVAIGILMTLLIVGGIASEAGAVGGHLAEAQKTITGWLNDLGIDPSQAAKATENAGSAGSDAYKELLQGVATGIAGLSSLVFFLALTTLSLFFLLKDGPTIRSWVEQALPMPLPLAETVTRRVTGSLRGYFVGVTVVAAYSAVVVGIGSLIIGVPLIGTIMVVTFIGGFIPYLGAWSAGAFAVLIALGGGGTEEAAAMAVLQLLANGILQQLVQPFAYGAALGIHPLAVLVVTIGGGALFGAVGLILAAPLTSAITRISADLARARQKEAAEAEDGSSEPGEETPPAAAGPVPKPAT
jgi:predicted PurR-regulated permease PerM